ncbi:phage head closure protein [Paenibacillus aurantiacus]|uniref:Phage head closure protein n=1 Tax=Paenibacillus aurantiacus TaxID=1936118 RepID=A0ABV5L1A9_9BACL
MMWRDVVYLLTPGTKTRDQYGAEVVGEPVQREVMANRKSVRQTEFYQAHAVGIRPEIVFEVQAIEYQQEQTLIHEGTTYHIVRTYSKSGEKLELVCSRTSLEG